MTLSPQLTELLDYCDWLSSLQTWSIDRDDLDSLKQKVSNVRSEYKNNINGV